MDDKKFMNQALSLALKGKGSTSPNPLVGAVLVKSGKVVGKGYHKGAGLDHAEIVAVKDAYSKQNNPKGCVLYVNLEPCCHIGKTGPCCEEIVRVGISEVVIANLDPSAKVNGKGVKFLKKHGVKVRLGILEDEAREMNQIFFKNSKRDLPYVTVKAGMSLDGKIATKKHESQWITSDSSRKAGRALRGIYDAVLVGGGTVKDDNPTLVMPKGKFQIVLDGDLSTPLSSKLYKGDDVIIVCTENVLQKKVEKLEARGVAVWKVGKSRVNFEKLLKKMYVEKGICSLFVEGGGGVIGSFFDAGFVDEVYFYYAPIIIGGMNAVSAVGGSGVSKLKDAGKIKKLTTSRSDGDILVHGYLNSY